MTLIEGIGDEVTDFFIFVSILIMGWFAWCSTNIGDQPLIQTVLILQHQTRTRFSELRSHSNLISVNNFSSFSLSESASSATNLQESSGNELNYPGVSIDADSSEIPASEEDLIEAMDSFHGNGNTIFNGQSKIAKAKSTNTVEVKNLSIHEATTEKITSLNNNINIKLKFINDDLKIVTSSLNELLGNFKRRHFQVELQSQKIVRLVFNGRVLQPDNQSLKKCGLYNDCVVHCLIHQPRSNTSPPAQSAVVNSMSSLYFNSQSFQDLSSGTNLSAEHNEWDLSRLLVSILALILGFAWYSRYHYAQLFTTTATFVLYLLTAIFTISLFSNLFSDHDSIRNIE